MPTLCSTDAAVISDIVCTTRVIDASLMFPNMGEIPGEPTMKQCPGTSGISSSDFKRPATDACRRAASGVAAIHADSPANEHNARVRRNNRAASRRQSQEMRTNFLAYPQPPS